MLSDAGETEEFDGQPPVTHQATLPEGPSPSGRRSVHHA